MDQRAHYTQHVKVLNLVTPEKGQMASSLQGNNRGTNGRSQPQLQTTLSQHVHCYENLQSNGQIKVGAKVGNIVVQKGSSHFLLSIHNLNALISSRSPPQLAKCSCLLIAISYKPWWFTIRRYTTSLDVIGLSDATLAIRPIEEKIILWCSGDILPLPGHCMIQENKFYHHIWMCPETKIQILELHWHIELS